MLDLTRGVLRKEDKIIYMKKLLILLLPLILFSCNNNNFEEYSTGKNPIIPIEFYKYSESIDFGEGFENSEMYILFNFKNENNVFYNNGNISTYFYSREKDRLVLGGGKFYLNNKYIKITDTHNVKIYWSNSNERKDIPYKEDGAEHPLFGNEAKYSIKGDVLNIDGFIFNKTDKDPFK